MYIFIVFFIQYASGGLRGAGNNAFAVGHATMTGLLNFSADDPQVRRVRHTAHVLVTRPMFYVGEHRGNNIISRLSTVFIDFHLTRIGADKRNIEILEYSRNIGFLYVLIFYR